VAHLDVSAAQRSSQFLVVVAGDAESDAVLDHGHDKPQDSGDVGPSIDQVSQEDRAPAIRRSYSSHATTIRPAAAIVFDLPEKVCAERNRGPA
jgi:hypothetical protein